VTDRSARGWLAGGRGRSGRARALHGGRSERAGAAWEITAGFEWGLLVMLNITKQNRKEVKARASTQQLCQTRLPHL